MSSTVAAPNSPAVYRDWKVVQRPGAFAYPIVRGDGEVVSRLALFTREKNKRYAQTVNSMVADGISIPIIPEHSSKGVPLTPAEMERWILMNSVGFIRGARINANGDLELLHEVTDPQWAVRMGTTVKDCSPGFRDWYRTGDGKKWTDVVAHVALTHHPVDHHKPKFKPASALQNTKPKAAGICLQASDTGRVLMLQRAISDDDPASGTWEFPGGHLEEGETPLQGAKREWSEETGLKLPRKCEQAGQWGSDNGVYVGYVFTIPKEESLDINLYHKDRKVRNPDDPDGDCIETLAWWNPSQLVDNAAVRKELQLDLAKVLRAIKPAGQAAFTVTYMSLTPVAGPDAPKLVPIWEVPFSAAIACLVPAGTSYIFRHADGKQRFGSRGAGVNWLRAQYSRQFSVSRAEETIWMAVMRAPIGGVSLQGKFYPGGQFIPNEVLEKATPEEKQKIAAAKEGRDAKRGADARSNMKDAETVHDAILRHAGAHGMDEQHPLDKRDTLRRWAALKAEHGEQGALERVVTLAAKEAKTLQEMGEDGKHSAMGKHYQRRLAAYAQMVGFAANPTSVAEYKKGLKEALAGEGGKRSIAEAGSDPSKDPVPPENRSTSEETPKTVENEAKNSTSSGSEPAKHPDPHQAIASAQHLSPVKKQQFGDAVKLVEDKLPQAAKDRLAKNVKGFTFHSDIEDLTAALIERSPDMKEKLGGKKAGGVYSKKTGELHLNGGERIDGKKVTPDAVYAHEYAHAIDGPEHELSKTADWKAAWKAEAQMVSRYATKTPQEGFAEFGRLVYSSGLGEDQLRERYPKMMAHWEGLGLLPEAMSKDKGGAELTTGNTPQMPDVFEEPFNTPDAIGDKPLSRRAEHESLKEYLRGIGGEAAHDTIRDYAKQLHETASAVTDEHNSAVKMAMEGLSKEYGKKFTMADLKKIEDHPSAKGFDGVLTSVVQAHPGLFKTQYDRGNWEAAGYSDHGETYDNAEKLWEMLKEGKRASPSIRDFEDQAVQEWHDNGRPMPDGYEPEKLGDAAESGGADTSFDFGENAKQDNRKHDIYSPDHVSNKDLAPHAIKRADDYLKSLGDPPPPPADGFTRLYRGTVKGAPLHDNAFFANDAGLKGIAVPFAKADGRQLIYVDVPNEVAEKSMHKGGVVEGNEFTLPEEYRDQVKVWGDKGDDSHPFKPSADDNKDAWEKFSAKAKAGGGLTLPADGNFTKQPAQEAATAHEERDTEKMLQEKMAAEAKRGSATANLADSNATSKSEAKKTAADEAIKAMAAAHQAGDKATAQKLLNEFDTKHGLTNAEAVMMVGKAKQMAKSHPKTDATSPSLMDHYLSANPDKEQYASKIANPILKQVDKGGWHRAEDVGRVHSIAGKNGLYEPTKVAGNILRELADKGYVIKAWDSKGNPYYAKAGEEYPRHLMNEEQIAELEKKSAAPSSAPIASPLDIATSNFMKPAAAPKYSADDIEELAGQSFTNDKGLTVDVVKDEDGTWSVGKKYGLTAQGAANYLNELKAEPAQSLFGKDVTAQQIAEGKIPKKQAWEGRSVDDLKSMQFKNYNPMWFDGHDDGQFKLNVKQNVDGTYDAVMQNLNHEHLKMPVSTGKDAEDTMNNIWRSGALRRTDEVHAAIERGVEAEKKSKQLQWPEPPKPKEKEAELPGMKDTFAPGMFGAAANEDTKSSPTPMQIATGEKPHDETTMEGMKAKIEGTIPDSFHEPYSVDWGTNRGQGKRGGGMVRGAMSDPPKGVKTYLNSFAKLPEDEAKEIRLHDDHERNLYSKARTAGLSHESAMRYMYAETGNADHELWWNHHQDEMKAKKEWSWLSDDEQKQHGSFKNWYAKRQEQQVEVAPSVSVPAETHQEANAGELFKIDDAVDTAQKNATPRDRSAVINRATDPAYAFARTSSVGNAGEDLMFSKRHLANAWRGLDQAEKDGTAEILVTRDRLLENEPHSLVAHADTNPLTAMAMHFAIKQMPGEPGYKAHRLLSKTTDPVKQKKNREQFVEAYRSIKAKAEELAQSETDPKKALSQMADHVGNMIRKLRGQAGRDLISESAATDRYNDTANALTSMLKPLRDGVSYGRPNTKSPLGKVMEFSKLLSEKHGEIPTTPEGRSDYADKLKSAAKNVIEGQSPAKAFGVSSGKTSDTGSKKPRIDSAAMYVDVAHREGGREVPRLQSGLKDHLLSQLGIRGLQFGNYVSDEERLHHLEKAAESLVDLADVTGLPDNAMSLGGQIGLAFGARGSGGALAHYEPSTKVINLTRKGGVGSLAHEWGHAMDHFLAGGGPADVKSKGIQSGMLSTSVSPERFVKDESGNWKKDERGRMVTENLSKEPVWAAMDAVRKAWKDSGFHSRVRDYVRKQVNDEQMDERKANDYWLSNSELFARSFEQWVQHELLESGRRNTYLAGFDHTKYQEGKDESRPYGSDLWPTREETRKMAPAFRSLLHAVREKHFSNREMSLIAASREERIQNLMIALQV